MGILPDKIDGALTPTAIDIANTATAIPATNASGRKTAIIRNNGDNTIFLGNDTVTVDNGWPLKAGEPLPIELGPNIVLYGIVASGTVELRILEGS